MSEWTRPAQPVRCVVDLSAPLTVRRERGVLVQGDENANAIVVEVYQAKDVPYDLSGSTVTLTFVRPDKLAAPPISAEIIGNVAVMTLTDICYRVSGLYAASVKLQKGNAKRTIVRLLGDIISTENNGTVADEQILPTPEELLVILQQAEAARDNANTAAQKANDSAASANAAAKSANESSESAQKEAAEANAAAERAEKAAQNWENGTAADALKLGGNPPEYYLPAAGTAVNSDKFGGKAPEYYLHAVNLLGNSDFINPVNQRGAIAYSTDSFAYTIDRWEMTSGANLGSNMELKIDGSVWYVALSPVYGHFFQKINNFSRYVGKTLTLAMNCSSAPSGSGLILLINTGITQENVEISNGLNVVSCFIPDGATQIAVGVQNNNADAIVAFYPVWAALYEGTYTADTLPPYVPNGYAMELAECRMFYQPTISLYLYCYANGYVLGANYSPMRTVPTPTDLTALNMSGDPIGGETTCVISTSRPGQIDYFANPNFAAGQYYRVSFELNADL